MTSEVAVDPLGEISVGQCLRALIDQDVVAERHVVDLVIRAESETLCTNLHADGLTQGFGVDVPLVVEDPIVSLVSVEWNLIFPSSISAVYFLEEVIPRVITQRRIITPISIVIVKGSEVIVLVEGHVAVGGVFVEVTRDGVSLWKFGFYVTCWICDTIKILAVPHGILALADGELVIAGTDGIIDFCGAIVGEWPRPKVVSVGSVSSGGQFELLVRTDSSKPQRASIYHAHP